MQPKYLAKVLSNIVWQLWLNGQRLGCLVGMGDGNWLSITDLRVARETEVSIIQRITYLTYD